MIPSLYIHFYKNHLTNLYNKYEHMAYLQLMNMFIQNKESIFLNLIFQLFLNSIYPQFSKSLCEFLDIFHYLINIFTAVTCLWCDFLFVQVLLFTIHLLFYYWGGFISYIFKYKFVCHFLYIKEILLFYLYILCLCCYFSAVVFYCSAQLYIKV